MAGLSLRVIADGRAEATEEAARARRAVLANMVTDLLNMIRKFGLWINFLGPGSDDAFEVEWIWMNVILESQDPFPLYDMIMLITTSCIKIAPSAPIRPSPHLTIRPISSTKQREE